MASRPGFGQRFHGIPRAGGEPRPLRYVSGTAVMLSGETIKVLKLRADYRISGFVSGVRRWFEFRDVMIIEPVVGSAPAPSARITTTDGTAHLLADIDCYCGWCGTSFDVDEHRRMGCELSLSGLQRLTIGRHVGSVRMNARTGGYFPVDFVFDPLTGEELVWSEPEFS